jgi:hypothetical protein
MNEESFQVIEDRPDGTVDADNADGLSAEPTPPK